MRAALSQSDNNSNDAHDRAPVVAVVRELKQVLADARLEAGSGAAGLADAQVQQVATEAWELLQQIQGQVLVPAVAQASERRLFRREPYDAASSMRDLIAGWLRCDLSAAGRLLELAKHCVTGGFRATGRALGAGEIDGDHARAVVRSVRSLPAGIMEERDYRRAESTMLDAARTSDPGVTTTAGARLLEVIAPNAAQEHADRKAERDRQRAEESRWFDVTGVGVAGCKELRLRAESDVVDTLMRVLTGLVQTTTVDQDFAKQTADTWSESAGGAKANVLEKRPDSNGPVQSPGLVAEGGVSLAPIERRRADAAVEVIDSLARPDLLDELTPARLRLLADQLETQPGSGSSELPVEQGINTNSDAHPDADTVFAELVDAGQVTTNSCDDRATADDPAPDPVSTVGAGPGPVQRSQRSAPVRPPEPGDGGPARGTALRGPARGVRIRSERPSLVVLVPYDQGLEGRSSEGHDGRRDSSRGWGRDRRRDEQKGQGGFHSGEVSSTGSPRRLASATEIARVACEAILTPVWMARDAGTPIAVAAPTRFFRGKQLAALIARDRGCAFPGCSRGLRYSHAHHIVAWSKGGPTTVENGVLLCAHHHRVVHRAGGWMVRMAADGSPEFIPPVWIDPQRRARRHPWHRTRLPVAA